MATLFDGTGSATLILPNRVVMAPMTRVRAAAGGLATPSMATYYAQRATAGLIVTEGVQPSLIGQSNPGTPGLYTDEQVRSWRPVTDAVHANGGRIFAQLMHGGRVSHPATTGMRPVGPSAVPAVGAVFTPTGPQPAPCRGRSTAPRCRSRPSRTPGRPPGRRRRLRRGGAARRQRLPDLAVPVGQRQPAHRRVRRLGDQPDPVRRRGGGRHRRRRRGARTGIRLSPARDFWGVEERDVPELYTALLTELARLGRPTSISKPPATRRCCAPCAEAWPGTLIMNPVLPMGPKQTAGPTADHWLGWGADLISFGRAFIANPDLVERLRTRLPIAAVDEAT